MTKSWRKSETTRTKVTVLIIAERLSQVAGNHTAHPLPFLTQIPYSKATRKSGMKEMRIAIFSSCWHGKGPPCTFGA